MTPKALSRAATAGAVVAAFAAMFFLDDKGIPKWAQSVGGTLARPLLACIVFFVTYVVLLVVGMGLLRGERIKRFSLRNAEFEFADNADDLKEIDLRLTEDMQSLSGLVADLANRVDRLESHPSGEMAETEAGT